MNEKNEVNLSILLKEEDYINYSIRHSLKYMIAIFSIYIVFFIAMILTTGNINQDGLYTAMNFNKILIPVYSVFGLIIVAVFFGGIYYKSKKVFSDESILHDPYIINLNETGFLILFKDGPVSLDWEKIFRIAESKNFYYLFLEKNQALIIPKRVFVETGDEKTYRHIIQNNMSAKNLSFK
jgi:hypothetical protein